MRYVKNQQVKNIRIFNITLGQVRNPLILAVPALNEYLPKATPQEKKVAALRAVPMKPAEPRMEKLRVTEELLIEEVSIDGMCGVY